MMVYFVNEGSGYVTVIDGAWNPLEYEMAFADARALYPRWRWFAHA